MEQIVIASNFQHATTPRIILDSNLSSEAKLLFGVLTLCAPSMPRSQELMKLCSWEKRKTLRDAIKELELRGPLKFIRDAGGKKQILLCLEIYDKPQGEILPLPIEKQKKPSNPNHQAFKSWFMEQYKNQPWNEKKEPYDFKGAKDAVAINRLLQLYGLEGAKLKALTAWGSSNTFFRNSGKSIAVLASVASRLVGEQIEVVITDPDKWKNREKGVVKL